MQARLRSRTEPPASTKACEPPGQEIGDAAKVASLAPASTRNAPSTEPAPRRPRSALKYGLMAAVPAGLCAAWFAWHAPLPDPGAIQATEVALKSEQRG